MPVPAWICDLGRVPYDETADLQRRLRAAREAELIPDTLLVLEHDPVITAGPRTQPHEVAYALSTDVPVVATERGGGATYHGPGQVVIYPVFALRDHGEDIRRFVRGLESSLIDTLADFGVPATRREGLPGVWTPTDDPATIAADGLAKIASIGLRVVRWVTYHGIALNVDCDLAPFGWFTPCGLPDVVMTSVAERRAELGADAVAPDGGAVPDVTSAAVRDHLVATIARTFNLDTQPVDAAEVRDIAAGMPEPEGPTPRDVVTPARRAVDGREVVEA
jgi:lipoyl(octanoyl) transferase